MRVPPLLSDVLFQAGGRYIAVALQVVRGLVLAAILGPLGTGTITAVLLVMGWAMYSDLGVGEAVMRELPLAIGSGDRGRQAAWKWYAVSGKVTGATLYSLGLLVVLVLYGDHMPSDMRFGLSTAVITIVLQQLVAAEQLVLQALRRFRGAAQLYALLPALSFALGVGGALIADVQGVFVGQLLAFAGTALVAVFMVGVPRRAILPDVTVRHLVGFGLPFALLSFAHYNLVYLDQLIAGLLLGRQDLGIYVIAQYVGTALFLLPQALAVAMGPRLLQRYGADPRPQAVAEYTWRPMEALSLALPPAIVTAWLVAPWLIRLILPKFEGAIGPLLIYSTAVFFLGLNLGASSTLFAFDRYRRNIPLLLAAIAFNLAVDVLFVLVLGLELYGIALGSLLAYTFYWLGHTRLLASCYGLSIRETLRRCMTLGWPGLVLSLVIAAFALTGVLDQPPVLAVAGILAGFLLLSLLRLRSGSTDALRHYLRGASG